ncbi:MAG: DUF5110 domain-containing protein [Dysgonamonadaceae bacterium]|jgi:alpha-D-xyloside xylohydrolase|nr:DUF5110 domain-containing protein [Dysgonamonadaceae bacterium]
MIAWRFPFFCFIALWIGGISSFAQPFQQTDFGVRAAVDSLNIEIQFYSPRTVRVVKSLKGVSVSKESLSVIRQPEKISPKVEIENNILSLKSLYLCVNLNLFTGCVSFKGTDNSLLLSEKEHSVSISRGKIQRVECSFLLDKYEPIYGLGQQQDGRMNRRGDSLLLRQENMKIAIPFFQSVKGYGLFWDNYSATLFTDGLNGTTFSSESGDCIDYYFLYGHTMDGTVACMRDLTGQVPLYPLWTWGYWQSKERYASQRELVETVEHYRKLNVPLDGIIQDWRYWSDDNAYWNALEFGNPEFPDPSLMMKQIHELNAHAILSVWPSFGVKTKPYSIFKEKGMLLDIESWPQEDSVKVYDAFNPEARDIYWDLMNKNLFSKGIDGWWLDATEPEYSNVTDLQLDQKTALGTFRQFRNAYPLMSVKGVYENQIKSNPDKRVFILTRSAFAGQQRYATTSWSGDVTGDWETFRRQIPAGLNFSLCGIPYWNTDIGGFFVRNTDSSSDDYRELYVRWLQFAAFTPMMRSHGTNTPREIWRFGQKGDWAYDAIEKFIRLRYRLLPYHYSLSWEVSYSSGSIMRMLSMDFPFDENVHNMATEYMYGRSFLAVPVTQPQARTYPVYLPQGSEWYDFWTGQKYSGGQTIRQEVAIDQMPLYVKAGSIIPLAPEVQYAEEKNWSDLELRIYPGADAVFMLYEDEKEGYNYEKGAYSIIEIRWDEAHQSLTIRERKGQFPGMLKERTFRIIWAGTEKEKTVKYSGKTIKI